MLEQERAEGVGSVTRVCVLATLVAALVLPSAESVVAKRKCTERRARAVIHSFVDAYNAGDLEALDAMFAISDFYQYRVLPLERGEPAASERQSLLSYFEERHGQGDVFTLKSLEVGRAHRPEGGFYFHAWLQRESKDLRPWGSAHFVPQKSVTGPDCRIRQFRIQWDWP